MRVKICMTGSTGLIGSMLCERLEAEGAEIIRYRRSTDAKGAFWDPSRGELDPAPLQGADAVIHLAGENIFQRWTDAAKRRIERSRVEGTELLARTLASVSERPKVLVSMSGINFYGDRGAEELDEDSGPGEGFLASLCQKWEAATRPAAEAGVRVVTPRMSVVLSRRGGALSTMLPPFKLGIAGKLGSGEQYMPWVADEDVIEAIRFAIDHDDLRGPFNVVAPQAVTNAEFTRTLGKVLHRPTAIPLPGFAARSVLKDLADEALLASIRARPRALEQAGFQFRWPELQPALEHLVGRPA